MEHLLDENGRGKLTKELEQIFLLNGCRPYCHICRKYINLAEGFRLKPFCERIEADKNGDKQSMAIMVCQVCDETEKVLPYGEFKTVLENFKLELPKHENKPDEYKKKLKLYHRILEKEGKDFNWREHSGSFLLWTKDSKIDWVKSDRFNVFHDLPYFLACDSYDDAVEKFHKKFTQFFGNENYIDYCVRLNKQWAAERARERKANPPRGGCFILTTGTNRQIIGSE